MTSISSIGGFGMEPNQFNVRATGLQGAKPAPAPGELPEGGQNPMMERIESLAVEAGLDPETIATLQEELQAAIAAALENANETAESGDPREAVHSAIESVLADYGISVEEPMPSRGGQDPMMAQVETLAAEAGLDAETTASLIEELQAAASAAVQETEDEEEDESDGSGQSVSDVVNSILEKYGIDADQLKPPAGMPGPAGAENSSAGSVGEDLLAESSISTNQNILPSLLDLLQVVDEEA